ncbi:MAG: hypothetical protein WB767_05260 [Nocardioides sp.]
MSDGVGTPAAAPKASNRDILRYLAPMLAQALLVVAVFAGVGAACGWLWFTVWTPPSGGVQDGVWLYEDFASIGDVFDATALYVVVGVGVGALLGVLTAVLVRRAELLMLVAVLAGSALAAWLSYRVGLHLSAPDPTTLAAGLPDGTQLDGNLELPGRSPFIAWPLGALVGLAVTYFLTTTVASTQQRDEYDPEWLQRMGPGGRPGLG